MDRHLINRGYNLVVIAVLFFHGLSMGPISFSPVENDWGDRVDDLGLFAVGLAVVI